MMEIKSSCANHRHMGRLFVATYFIAFIISKYVGFSLGYALDDYIVTSKANADSLIHLFLSQGRFSFAIVQHLLTTTNLSMSDFHTIALVGISLFSGLMFSSMLNAPECDNPLTIISIASLLGTYPYFAEYVSFHQAALPMALMFLFLWLSFDNYSKWVKHSFHGAMHPAIVVIFAVIAAGFNQLAFSFLCIGLLVFTAQRVTTPLGSPKSKWWMPFYTSACGGIAVGIPYLLVAYIVRIVYGVPSDARATMLSVADMPERVNQVLGLVIKIFIEKEPIVSVAAKAALLISLLAVAVFTSAARLRNTAYTLSIFVTAIGLALLPIAISGTWWPVPRTLIAVPFAFAGAILLLSREQARWRSLVSFVALSIASLLFTAHSNAILTNQLRLNRWDLSTARDIFTAASQRFPEETGGIVLNDPKWSYPAAPGIADGDLNVSALSIGWAAKPVFKEATGRDVNVRTSTDFTNECSAKGIFPAGTSLFVHGDEVVVCM